MYDFFFFSNARTRAVLKAVVERERRRGEGESWRGQLDESRVRCGGRKVGRSVGDKRGRLSAPRM